MAVPSYLLARAFLRHALDGAATVADAQAALVALLSGQYTSVTASGKTVVTSEVSDTRFTWQVNGTLSPEGILAHAEAAAGILDNFVHSRADSPTVDEAKRVLLTRRKSRSRSDFSGFTAH